MNLKAGKPSCTFITQEVDMQLFKEQNGKPSYTRIFGAAIIIVLLFTGVKVVWSGAVTQIPDIPTNWAMLVGALYGFNAFKTNGKS